MSNSKHSKGKINMSISKIEEQGFPPEAHNLCSECGEVKNDFTMCSKLSTKPKMKTIKKINKKFDELVDKLLQSSSDSNEMIYLTGGIPVPKGNNRDDCLYNLGLIESKIKIKSFYTQQILSLIEELEKGLPKKKEEYRCFKNKGWNDKNRCEHTLCAYNIGKIDGQNFTIDQMRSTIKSYKKGL